MSMAGKCKVVSGRNGKRKICWGANGKIKSNTRASGTAGLGATKRRKTTKRRKPRGVGKLSPETARLRKKSAAARKAKRPGSLSTFVAKASFARTKAGKIRKGCKKVGSVYRCRRPGK